MFAKDQCVALASDSENDVICAVREVVIWFRCSIFSDTVSSSIWNGL